MLGADEDIPDKDLLRRARAALQGWVSRYPQCSRTGEDPLIWFLIAKYFSDSEPRLAAALLLQLDTYARPSEILKEKRCGETSWKVQIVGRNF